MGRHVIQTTISTGTSLSTEFNVDRGEIVGLRMPAGWDAASITFAALTREAAGVSTFGKVQDSGGTEVTITTPAADTYVAIAEAAKALRGLGRVKIRSGTAAAAVNQTADRVIGVVVNLDDD